MMDQQTKPQPSASAGAVPRSTKLLYGIGQITEGTATGAINGFAFFYYTAVLGLSGTLAGAAMFISLTIDAVGDPLLGSISDNMRSRWGRRHPMMALSALPILICLGMLFSAPAGLGQFGLFVWMTICAVVLRIAISMFTIPYTALGTELTNDYGERSSIVIYRIALGYVGGLVTVILGYMVFLSGPRGLLDAPAYPGLGWSLAAVAVVAVIICTAGTLASGRGVSPEAPPTRGVHSRLFGEVSEVFRSSSFRVLFGGLILFSVALGANMTLGLHANTFFWRFTSQQIQTISLVFFVGLLAGVAIMPLMSNRFEKRTIGLVGVGLLCFALGFPPTLRLLGFLNADDAALTAVLSANAVLIGISATMAAVAFNSMLGDAADEHEARFGTRREGLYFAGLAFATKAASGIGTLFAGVGLDLIGFPKELGGRAMADVVVSPSSVQGLGIVYGPGTALLAMLSLLILRMYSIDRRRHAEIVQTINERRRVSASHPGAVSSSTAILGA